MLEQKRQREKAAGVGGNNAQSSNVNDSDSGDDDADGTSCREEEGGIATSHKSLSHGRLQTKNNHEITHHINNDIYFLFLY